MIEKHDYKDKYEIVMGDEVIYTEKGTREWPSQEAINAILENSGFEPEQKESLMAVLGHLNEIDHTDQS